MLIKRAVLLLLFRPYLIKTADMVADIFMKALEKGAFVKFRNRLMNASGLQYTRGFGRVLCIIQYFYNTLYNTRCIFCSEATLSQ